MKRKVKCIMLIDDNPDDNFFHDRVIKKNDAAEIVVSMHSGAEAINFLTSRADHEESHPDLIFLDINMPGMNGWEFLDEFKKLDKEFQSKMVVVMLTTSDNPDDKVLAKTHNLLSDFRTKPLTKEMLDEILNKYYSE